MVSDMHQMEIQIEKEVTNIERALQDVVLVWDHA